MIAVPTDVTEVEKKAFYDLVMHSEAKAKSVRIVERGLADAVGLGLDVMNETGILLPTLVEALQNCRCFPAAEWS